MGPWGLVDFARNGMPVSFVRGNERLSGSVLIRNTARAWLRRFRCASGRRGQERSSLVRCNGGRAHPEIMEYGIRKLRQCQPTGMAKLVVEQQDPIQHAGGNVLSARLLP
jgi:hypothetical protein